MICYLNNEKKSIVYFGTMISRVQWVQYNNLNNKEEKIEKDYNENIEMMTGYFYIMKRAKSRTIIY